jgi:hypothetical protein
MEKSALRMLHSPAPQDSAAGDHWPLAIFFLEQLLVFLQQTASEKRLSGTGYETCAGQLEIVEQQLTVRYRPIERLGNPRREIFCRGGFWRDLIWGTHNTCYLTWILTFSTSSPSLIARDPSPLCSPSPHHALTHPHLLFTCSLYHLTSAYPALVAQNIRSSPICF